jgi:hypothetical protein
VNLSRGIPVESVGAAHKNVDSCDMGMQSMELPAQMSRLEDLMALKTDAEDAGYCFFGGRASRILYGSHCTILFLNEYSSIFFLKKRCSIASETDPGRPHKKGASSSSRIK